MFTGLVSEIGVVRQTVRVSTHLRLTIHAPMIASEASTGDSVNISGACQTISAVDGDRFSVDTVPETLKKTTLGDLRIGNRVNLEQAVRPSDRLGGHIVSGHVDCVGTVRELIKQSSSIEVVVAFPDDFENLVVPQGSISIDGISLTVAALNRGLLRVAVIPTTWEMTTLPELNPGSRVNLEFDVIGKYVVRYMERRKAESRVDERILREFGY